VTIAPTISNWLSDRRMTAPREGAITASADISATPTATRIPRGHGADEGAVCGTHEFAAR
jgi:hypothetical protein